MEYRRGEHMVLVKNKIIENLELPVIAAPMFLISNPKMVIEACKAGIIGSFPLLNARTTEILGEWMNEIITELEAIKKQEPTRKIGPWAVNMIVHKSNKRYEEDIKLIKKYQPPIVIASLGDPSRVTDIVHEYGGLVFSDVINLSFAKKAIQKGVDGLVLVCSGAGGHGGIINPMAFISAVREFWDGITILSGAISNGNEILAAQILGADLVFMGTRFIVAEESSANSEYRQMIVDSTFEEIIYTDAFSGINANFLIKSIKKAGLDPNHLQAKKKGEISYGNQTEAKAWKDIWSAGHGVTTINKVQSVAEIVSDLKKSYQKSLQDIRRINLPSYP